MTRSSTGARHRAAVLVLAAATTLVLSACGTGTTSADSSRAAAGAESPTAAAGPSSSATVQPAPSQSPSPLSSPTAVTLGTRVCVVNDTDVELPIKATEYDTLENPATTLVPGEQSCASRATATVFRVSSPDQALVTRLTAQSKSSGFVVNVLSNPAGATGRLLDSQFTVDEGVSVNVTPYLVEVQRTADSERFREFTVSFKNDPSAQ